MALLQCLFLHRQREKTETRSKKVDAFGLLERKNKIDYRILHLNIGKKSILAIYNVSGKKNSINFA